MFPASLLDASRATAHCASRGLSAWARAPLFRSSQALLLREQGTHPFLQVSPTGGMRPRNREGG